MPLRNLPPFVLSLDSTPFYNHDIYPNHVYRRLHERQHDPLDLATLGLIARLGPHAHHLTAKQDAGKVAIPHVGKNGFEVHLDVGLFKPEDLSVKVVDDYLVVEGKHEEREDEHGHISRHFKRRYLLPKGYNPDAIESTLTADGALTLRVPKPEPSVEEKKEIIIPIQHTGGPSDLFAKNGSQEVADEKSH